MLDQYIELANDSTRPSIAAAWWRKGIAYEQLGKTQKAIICHEKSLESDEGFTRAKEALERLRKEN
jgi:tetratricopeptide (TPR) repeat protein